MRKDWFLVGTTVFSGFLLSAGCSLINAPSEVTPADGAGGSGGGASSSSSSSSSSGVGGMGGGSSGSTSSGMTACTPGTQMPCYDGTPGTVGIGECRAGNVTCIADGTGYGPCVGQVVNAATDDCKTPLFDENCDGVENDACPGEQLAIVAAAPPGYADEVRSYLMDTMKFDVINVYDASISTPALAELQVHQSVLVFSDKVFVDPVGLGDVLADYYDAGGRVVVAMFSTVGGGTRIQGRFGNPAMGYLLSNPNGSLSAQADDVMGMVLEPQNRLMRDVSAFAAISTYKLIGEPINGATVVARWMGGPPLIVRGVVQGRNRVDINFYPPSTQMGMPHWTGDGVPILRNALLY